MKNTVGYAIICPYCEHEFIDSFEYESGGVECENENCQKMFMVEVETVTEYHSSPIQCQVIGEEHDYRIVGGCVIGDTDGKEESVQLAQCEKCLRKDLR